MNIIQQLKKVTWGKYMPKSDGDELKKLSEDLDEIKYKKLKDTLIESIDKKKYTPSLKKIIDELSESLKKEGVTKNEACELIDEAIKEIDDDNLELELDQKCDRYNKFTENNPAEYISYDKTHKNYQLIIPKEKKVSSNNLSILLKKLKEKHYGKNQEKFFKFSVMKKILYKNKKIIIYISEDNNAYFDLNHTVNLFDDLKAKQNKYDEYKNEIVLYDVRSNEFGGLYVKEFITKETFFKIILHTNSVFSNKFKDDVAKLLDNLTNTGNIVIKNDQLIVSNFKQVDKFIEQYEYTQTYDNIELVEFIKEQIRKV